MKKTVLTFALITMTALISEAKYDAFNCRSSSVLESAHLQCLSCGVQNFVKKKYPDSKDYAVPSEKWLTMLGMMTRQNFLLDPKSERFRDSNIETNLEARKVYQSRVAAMIQAYGFCINYNKEGSKKDITRPAEISMRDYNGALKAYITQNVKLDNDRSNKVAEGFGFKNSWLGSRAGRNMQALIVGHSDGYESKSIPADEFVSQSISERRQSFLRRVDGILSPSNGDSDASLYSGQVIASGDDDNGLRNCLEEIKNTAAAKGPNTALNSLMKEDTNSMAMCAAMTDACEIPANVCNGGSSPASSSVPSSKQKAPININSDSDTGAR